jgi:predicted nucleic acid-binding protein
MWSEGLSALVEGAFRGDIPAPALDEALERLEALSIALQEVDGDHRRRSLRLARSLGWAKSYDAEYVALAQALACPLLTVDARLTRGAGHLVEMLGPEGLYTR